MVMGVDLDGGRDKLLMVDGDMGGWMVAICTTLLILWKVGRRALKYTELEWCLA